MTQIDKQDIMDILSLIGGAQIRFADAERAVELRRKLEAMLEEQEHPQYPDVDYRTLDPKKQAKDAPRV